MQFRLVALLKLHVAVAIAFCGFAYNRTFGFMTFLIVLNILFSIGLWKTKGRVWNMWAYRLAAIVLMPLLAIVGVAVGLAIAGYANDSGPNFRWWMVKIFGAYLLALSTTCVALFAHRSRTVVPCAATAAICYLVIIYDYGCRSASIQGYAEALSFERIIAYWLPINLIAMLAGKVFMLLYWTRKSCVQLNVRP